MKYTLKLLYQYKNIIIIINYKQLLFLYLITDYYK